MPGLLKKNAKCPVCGDPLLAICNTYHAGGERITREYYHERRAGAKRRRPKCVRRFRGKEQQREAWREERRLNATARQVRIAAIRARTTARS